MDLSEGSKFTFQVLREVVIIEAFPAPIQSLLLVVTTTCLLHDL